jgi:hypothetical protein
LQNVKKNILKNPEIFFCHISFILYLQQRFIIIITAKSNLKTDIYKIRVILDAKEDIFRDIEVKGNRRYGTYI